MVEYIYASLQIGKEKDKIKNKPLMLYLTGRNIDVEKSSILIKNYVLIFLHHMILTAVLKGTEPPTIRPHKNNPL